MNADRFDLEHPALDSLRPLLLEAQREGDATRAEAFARTILQAADEGGFLNGHVLADVLAAARTVIDAETWPAPKPVAARLREVPALEADLIPMALRPWLLDISNRMQVRPEMVAIAAVVLAGSLIGAGCGIHPKRKDDWLEVPNLWGCTIAPPASGKSPSRAEVFKPLAILEAEAEAKYQADLRECGVLAETAKAREEAARDALRTAAKGKGGSLAEAEAMLRALRETPPDKAVKQCFRSNDTTVEKLGELLAANPRGILVERDELVGWLASLDREGREADRAFYLEAWGGKGSFTTHRIGRGEIHIPRCCVSVYGATQPDKILGYLDAVFHALGNDGLLQRFQLLSYPDPVAVWRYRDQAPDHAARSRAYGVYRHLAGMDFAAAGAALSEHAETPAFRFSDDAQAVFVDWLTDLENRLRGADEHPILVEHLGKYRGLMPSLALIFHLVEIAAGAPGGPVTLEAARLALRWCDYLEQHARRVYGLVIDAHSRAPAELAARVRKGQLRDGFSLRDVYRRGWSLLHTPELAQAAIDDLVEAGWLLERLPPEHERRPGRPPKPTYSINPRIYEMEEGGEK